MAELEPARRLFVAIELSQDWLRALEIAQQALSVALERHAGPRLRWVRPEGVHLTLKFLGQVSESRLASVHYALEHATRVAPRFSLALNRLGSFVDRRGPRVVWVGLDGVTVADREKLDRLVEDLETWFASSGFPREQRFQPHLTLARVPEDATPEQRRLLATLSMGVELTASPALEVSRVSLMQSHLGPGGASYERLAAFPE